MAGFPRGKHIDDAIRALDIDSPRAVAEAF